MMKALAVGLLAFCGIMTESFTSSGLLGCIVYGLLCVLGVSLFCAATRKN